MFEIILQKQISCVYIYSVLLFYFETARSGWSQKKHPHQCWFSFEDTFKLQLLLFW